MLLPKGLSHLSLKCEAPIGPDAVVELDSCADRAADAMNRKPESGEIHPGPGFRIAVDFPRPQVDLVAMFSQFSSVDISDQLNRLYGMEQSIHCIACPERPLIGPACTVKVFPGDNLMVHKALDVAAPGDVVVIDAGGSINNAVLGDIISTKARHRGLAGFVVDGYVRDAGAIRAIDFPVYARGENLIGPLHRGPGEINFPICCGGVVVTAGDIIVADVSGVVVIPREHIDAVYTRLMLQKDKSAAYLENVRRGVFSNAWVDQLLIAAGCKFV
jgi:RraA family protein